jgi:hypothetical protein
MASSIRRPESRSRIWRPDRNRTLSYTTTQRMGLLLSSEPSFLSNPSVLGRWEPTRLSNQPTPLLSLRDLMLADVFFQIGGLLIRFSLVKPAVHPDLSSVNHGHTKIGNFRLHRA